MTTKHETHSVAWKEKDSVLQIRLPQIEKDQFVKICSDIDSSASRELRLFIRGFIKKHNQSSLF